MTKATIGYAMCGSFCTFSQAFEQMQKLVDSGYRVLPIMSGNAYSTDTRFGKAEEMVKTCEDITGEKVLHTSVQTEPIGPKKNVRFTSDSTLHRQHTCKAVARRNRHLGNNGGKITSAYSAACTFVRCNKRRTRSICAEHRQTYEHKEHLFCPYAAG